MRTFRSAFEADDDEIDKERKQKLKGVDQAAHVISTGMEDEIAPVFGLCSSCTWFHGATTKFGRIYAKCDEMGIHLTSADPVLICTYYDKRGALELRDLKEMAILIEVKTRKIGFGEDD